jgi:hypothetical protein
MKLDLIGGNTQPDPIVKKMPTIPGMVAVSRTSDTPSHLESFEKLPDVAFQFQDTPALPQNVFISACSFTNASNAVENLEHNGDTQRDLTYKMTMVNTMSPGDVSGHPALLFFDMTTHHEHFKKQHPSIGALGLDEVPVIVFAETAWSETLKTLDEQLASRVMRWQYSARALGNEETPPLAIFLVKDRQKFKGMVRENMPFVYSSLTQ